MIISSNNFRRLLCATSSIAVITLSSSTAFAASVDELEAKLDKAMKLIESQAKQMQSMTNQISKIQNQKGGSASGDIEDRLAEVEETVYNLDDKIGSRAVANAFDAASLDIGGFVHTTYTMIDSDAGSASAWDTQNFELLIKADIDDQWSAFFAGGFLREEGDGKVLDATGQNPEFAIANKNPQIIGWVNYKHNDSLNVQVGRMIAPHGIINIEHFPQILLDPRQPQFLRPFSGDTIFPNFITGAQVHGKHFLQGDNQISYNFYAATAQSDPEAMLYGGRVAGTHGESGITVGLNASFGSRDDNNSNSEYTMVGADLLVDHNWLLWKSEIFQTSEDQVGFDDRLGWYTQPAWRINDQWTAFYRYDYLDDGNDANGGETVENVLGITYKPKAFVHLRVTGTDLDMDSGGTITQDRDAKIVQASTTVSF